MTAYPYLSPKEAIPQAKAAAKRALEIDPSLAEAHTALANSLACFDWNWEEAEHEFKRALELNPNDSGTHWRYGMFYLMLLGRSDEAIAEGKRAVELEPLNLNNGANLSGMYFYGRQYDRALAEAKQVFDLDPNFIVGRWALSQAYIVKGQPAEAITLNEQALQNEPTNQVFLRFAGIAYAKAGRRREAEESASRPCCSISISSSLSRSITASANATRPRRKPVIERDNEDSTRWRSRSSSAPSALLALQQPMARDLRFIVGAIKISSDLERVGDHAVNIAQAVPLRPSGARARR